MQTINVTPVVQVKVSEGTHGRVQTWADKKHVLVALTLDAIGKPQGRVLVLIPWGLVYGKVRKYEDAKDVGLDRPVKEIYDKADVNKGLKSQNKKR